MDTGIDLLSSRINRGKSFNANEELNLIDIIPPVFRIFAESFEWKKDAVKSKSFYYLPFLEGGEIYLENWDYRSKYSNEVIFNDEEMEERGLLLIATSHRGIYLGTRGEDIDKIFSTTSSVEGSIVKIADNIFEFVRGLTDNLFQISQTEEEYKSYMTRIGFEGEDLNYEVNYWKKHKKTT